VRPDAARGVFSPAQVDAREADFSDRISGKRKSYKASTRRQQRREDGTEEYGDFSDEDGESLERKLARLKREIEEVKEEYGRRNAEKRDVSEKQEVNEDDITSLSRTLDGLSTLRAKPATTGGKLAKDLGTGIKANGPPQNIQPTSEPATYTVTYAPVYQQSHALAKAADFDGRLAMLEKSLGLSSSAHPTAKGTPVPRAILPTLETLQRQISLLSDSTPSSLDSISRRVRTLTQEAERLEESRKSARAARDALKAAGGDIVAEEGEDSEHVSKVNALYGTLSTIENLAPLLPSLLDRLRSLRAIHADAATASESLERAEKKQADMAGDIKKWKAGLEKVEDAMKNAETAMNGNMKIVEGWVKELEAKVKQL
jgi:nuclear migration protein JNM1